MYPFIRFKRHKHTDPRRDWIWQNLPKGREGFSFEDLDGIVNVFSSNGWNRPRLLMLIEHKWNVTEMKPAQRIAFKEIDAGLKIGLKHYRGSYLVTWPGIERNSSDDEYVVDFQRKPKVNGREVSWDDLRKFYLGALRFRGLFDDAHSKD